MTGPDVDPRGPDIGGPVPAPFARRHPENQRFEWQERTGPFRLLASKEALAYDRDGFFVLPDAVDRATLNAILQQVDPIEADATAFYAEPNLTFTCNRVQQLRVLREFCQSRLVCDLCYDLVGRDVDLYWDQAVYKRPGSSTVFPWHQDNGYRYVEPQQYLTCWLALTDATPQNGCLRLVPGIHRYGTLEHRPSELGHTCVIGPSYATMGLEDAVAVPASAGSLVVFSSLAPHATGPNSTNQTRKAYVFQFAPRGIRAIGSNGQPLPGEILRPFPILERGLAAAAVENQHAGQGPRC
jgi:ectoine hydroxylase-related dioxygenase (phytanoyl-CoA dioxygenase family)